MALHVCMYFGQHGQCHSLCIQSIALYQEQNRLWYTTPNPTLLCRIWGSVCDAKLSVCVFNCDRCTPCDGFLLCHSLGVCIHTVTEANPVMGFYRVSCSNYSLGVCIAVTDANSVMSQELVSVCV